MQSSNITPDKMLTVGSACLYAGVVDACLIPEVPFKLDGPTGLFSHLQKIIHNKGHAVLCVAEGAGQVRQPADRRLWK